jgi:hypothetical protein
VEVFLYVEEVRELGGILYMSKVTKKVERGGE